ncbi:Spo0B domain-containing protein [Halobacillus litoralis]|uniref:Spo0B domain-containing protein n=1 Tax=Halobacillus litoralis TaxID=45668 RepID=UPI001CD5E968|nr:Spo0B domain-containing protein [Halobacillus litoralis]MCA0969946.1 Spo0B domain-containing protein [Halobacillus litoralis]
MGEEEIITLLRHKRHDWMNQIQLIQGYASLGKQDRLLDQISQVKDEAEQERRLLNSRSPAFTLWLMSFNYELEQFRLTYELKENIDLSRHDSTLLAYGKKLLQLMEMHHVDGELYEGTVTLYKGDQPSMVGVSWEWDGVFQDGQELKRKLDEEGFISTIFEDQELSVEMTIE